MRKVILYIAASLDGKIARPDGDVEWLHQLPNPENTDYGYQEFLAGIDTTLMGNKTYQKILGFDIPFPYQDKTNYVFTRNSDLKEAEFVKFISNDIPGFVKKLKSETGKDIWLIGGGEIIKLLIEEQLLDEMRLYTMPILLGAGIPLFPEGMKEVQPRLIESHIYSASGVIMSRYAF